MATDSTLRSLQRRLERWELNHLRQLAAELHERLERAEDEARRAWESAEFWRENAMQLQEELMDEGATIGLTKEGQLVVVKDDSAANSRPITSEINGVESHDKTD
jgi:hypothetical protein